MSDPAEQRSAPAERRGGTALVWFRRDFRLADNPAWAAAVEQADAVLAVVVIEPALRAGAGPMRRRQFDAEVHALDRSLRAQRGGLVVRTGDPSQIVPRIAAESEARVVHVNGDVTRWATDRDGRTAAALDRAGIELVRHWGTLAQPPGAVLTKAGSLSRVFTPFHKRWLATARPPGAVLGDPGVGTATLLGGDETPVADPGAAPQPPGEQAARDRLHEWLTRIERYRDDRDRPAVDGTSALSVDLRFGTISPWRIIDEAGPDASADRAAFVRQLAWRDWYAHTTLIRPDIDRVALRGEYDEIAWHVGADADEMFTSWCEGRTGYPLVDAGMRELVHTGRMHNRVRMVTASFLVKDLLIDWRRGERFFRHHLLDGDIPQNAGNWQWVAGTGPDAAPWFRIFNPTAQSRKFDPGGAYIRRWVPELAELDDRTIHEPVAAAPLDLAAAGVVLGDSYPEPIVDHAEAREDTLAAYRAAVGKD